MATIERTAAANERTSEREEEEKVKGKVTFENFWNRGERGELISSH